jgi:hypothetical protein
MSLNPLIFEAVPIRPLQDVTMSKTGGTLAPHIEGLRYNNTISASGSREAGLIRENSKG